MRRDTTDVEPELRPNAREVLAARYLEKGPDGRPAETPADLFRRVADAVAEAERLHGASEAAAREVADAFYELMASRRFMPNSPTLMNAGRPLGMLSACFVLPVPDSMHGIFTTLHHAALIQKAGGGTGFDFSRLRPRGDRIATSGGTTSGPVSFMKVYSEATGAITQGAFRRGANMGMLRVDHPDVLEFIRAKEDLGVLTNFNVSVSLTDEFMEAATSAPGTPHQVANPRDGTRRPLVDAAGHEWTAGEVFDLIVQKAWATAEPGVVFIDRVNRDNPTPALGPIEATNPCIAGGMRLATDRGLLPMDELWRDRTEIRVLTDDRVRPLAHAGGEGGVLAPPRLGCGVTLRRAVPVFRTRADHPVLRLVTDLGLEVVATPDHRLHTPDGPRALADLRPLDAVLVQSGAGVWSQDHGLPPFEPGGKLAARVRRGEAVLPTRWSRELGELLGWVVGDGWVSGELPEGRTVPNYTIGLCYGDEEKRLLAPRFRARVREWLGMSGTQVERAGTFYQYYKSGLWYFLRSLGLTAAGGLAKRVPEALWRSPREAVVGFLSALFTADGTVNTAGHSRGSVRLASSSKALLQDVQLLLLNEGILSRLYRRREAHVRRLPDARRLLREYAVADQYELVLTRGSLVRFVERIGFLTPTKQRRADLWRMGRVRGPYREDFVARVRSVEGAGRADVYCTTEPETHSLIVQGLAVGNCGEQPLLPYEACNLGSINLERFVVTGGGPPRLDEEALAGAARLATRFLDDVIDVNRYPVPEIEAVCKGNRKVGLGLMGFADALFRMGLAYDSPEAVAFGGRAMQVLDEASHRMSEDLARERGVFPNWKGSAWEARGRRVRNATTSTVAPTGTISIIAGCSGGIEPVFGLAFHRNVLDGRRLVEVNPVFQEAAEAGGWWTEALAERLAREGGVSRVEGVPEEARRIFVSAHDIAPEAHVRMQAAFQAHCDASISKTTNFPRHATPGDVRATYVAAWRAGLKGVTVYRDGCRADQPMALAPAPGEPARAAVEPVRLPEIMPAVRIRQLTPFGNMHVKVTVDPRAGVEREVFAQLGKGGDIANSDLEAICRLLSLFLRSGGALEVAMDQLAGIGSSLVIPSRQGRVTSLADGLAKALGRYRAARERHGLRAILLGEADLSSGPPSEERPGQTGEPVESHWKLRCPECSEVLAFEEGCVTCRACGFSLC